MYIYFRDGEEGYTRRMRDWYSRGGDNPNRTSALTTCTRRGQGTYQNSVYARGPLVMHMLRESLGQELILKYMFTLAEYGRGGALTTDDLQLVLETVSGQGPGSFETFFDYYIRGNFDLRRPVEEVLQQESARPEEPTPVRSEPPPEVDSPEGA